MSSGLFVAFAMTAMLSGSSVAMAQTEDPNYIGQPSLNATCSPGVCGKGRWASYFSGKTEPQCKEICDGFRKLIPEPEGINEFVYTFRQHGQFASETKLKGGKMKPNVEQNVKQINYRGTGSAWPGWKGQRDHFYARWEAKIEIKKPGTYKFWTVSDDGSRLWVNSKHIVDNPGWHGMRERSGSMQLTAGKFDLVAEMFEGGGGAGMELKWQGPDSDNRKVIIPASAFPNGVDEKGYFFSQNGQFKNVDSEQAPMATRFKRQVNNIAYRGTGGYWDDEFRKHRVRDQFYARWEGFIIIKQAGAYTFFTRSDDGSRLFIEGVANGEQVVNNPGWHGMRDRSGKREMTAGKHKFWAEMFEGGGGAGMELYYQGPDTGNRKQIIPASALSGSLQSNGKLILPESAFKGLCVAYSHQAGDCILYSQCESVEPDSESVCEDPQVQWAGTLADFKTCQYPEPKTGTAPGTGAGNGTATGESL